jgi:hypothetical protein
MCGRYACRGGKQKIAEAFQVNDGPLIAPSRRKAY